MKREINLLFLLLLLVLGRSTTATAQIGVSDGNPYEEDFEGSTTFSFENNTSYHYTNQWYIGTAASHGGQKGLYITEDGGTTNTYKQNENSMVFAYVPFDLGSGKHQISYDWRGKGDRNNAYLRVALVPNSEGNTIFFHHENPQANGFGPQGLPEGWIALDGGSQLAESSVWRSEMARITISEGGYYLVFAWRTNSSDSFMNPAAGIDNVRVEKVNVFVPELPVASNITAQSATIIWTDTHASTWNIRYKKASESVWNTISSVSQNSYTLTSLDSGAEYEVQVQAVDGIQQSAWTASTAFNTAVMVSQGNPYEEGFEGSTLFQFSNRDVLGTKWYIGTAAHNGTGSTKGLYISDDDGATNSYINSYSIGTTEFAYVQFSLENGRYDIAYDWRCQGRGGDDFMRVAVVPASTDFVGGSMPTGFSYNTLPTDWIAADGGSQLCNQSQWTTKNVSLTLTNAGDYYLVFVWHNHGGFYDNPPAAVDNIRVEKWIITTPTELAISNITTNSAKATWQDTDASAWNLRYKKTSQSEWNTISALSQKEYTLTGLDSGTEYEVQVQAVEDDQQSAWTASVTFCTKFAVDINHPYMEKFEGSTLFQFANGNTGNKWYIGTAAYNGSGTKGLYISNDDGNTNAYDNTASIAYAYVPITLEAGKHEISYDWKCNGESSYDYLRVALVPASVNLTGGSAPSGFSYNSLPQGWIALDGGSKLNLSPDWSSKTAGLTISGEGDYYLVFVWRNDGSQDYNPPAAIDNILVAKVNAFTPSQLAVSDITTNSAKATWTDNDASAWNIRYKKTSDSEWNTISSVSQNPYTLTGLDSSTEYEVQVQTTSTEGQSAWTASAIFSTVPTYTLTYDANGATSGNVPVDPNSPYIADATVTVLGNTGGLIKTNHNFNGWNTKTDGTGTAYAAGETFQISTHTVLYAQWLYDMTIIDPDNLHASLITGKSATLNWSAGSNSNPTGWNLDYKLHDAQAWTNLATNLAAATTNYLLENLVVDTEYDFRVQAIFGNNTSSWVEASFSTASTIVIGEATYSTHILPTFSTSKYSLTQQIYTADEINRTGFITSIAFNCTSGSGNWRNLDIYLVQTDKSTFDDETDWIHVTEDDLHFGYRMVEFKEGWSTIELLPPFEYDGLSNLCLVVYDHTQYACPDNDRIECMTIGTGVPSGLACINSNEINPNYPPTNSSATQYHKNQLRLTFEDTPAPIYFEFSDLTATDATVTWTPCGQETSWELQYVDFNIEDEDDNWDQAQTVTVTDNSHTYILSGLTPRTWYKSRIRAVVENDYSKWSETLIFPTPCLEEDKIPVSFILRNYQGTGWDGTELYVYDEDQYDEFEPLTLDDEMTEQTVTLNFCDGDYIYLEWSRNNDSDPVPYSFDVVIDGGVVFSMEEYSSFDYGIGSFIVEAPSCPAPQGLTASVTPDQTILTWDGTEGTEWVLAYKQIGDDDWQSIEGLTEPTYTLEGLSTNRYYKYQVASVCYNEELAISVPYYFYVPMCPVEEQCIYTFELDVKDGYDRWFGASLSVVDADSEEEIASLTINEGDDIPKTVALPLCQGTNIELVWHDGYYSYICGFEAFDGNGELVAAKNFDEVLESWYIDEVLGYGHIIDIGEVACGSCRIPKNLQASNIGMESATLNWTPGNEETAWNLQFRPIDALTDLNDWTGIELIPLTEPFITFETLSPATSYQFRVQAVCGVDDESPWTRPYTFVTSLCAPANQCTYTFNLSDSYGDGWNGAKLEVKDVETDVTISTIELPSDRETTVELPLCDGREIAFIWHKGNYDSECSFEVYDGNGNLVAKLEENSNPGEGDVLEVGYVDCENGFVVKHILQLRVNGVLQYSIDIDAPSIALPTPTTGIPEGFSVVGWIQLPFSNYVYFDENIAPEGMYTTTYPAPNPENTTLDAVLALTQGDDYKYYTTFIRTAGDRDRLYDFQGVHIIEGEVKANECLYNNNDDSQGLIIIKDGGVLDASYGIYNSHADALIIEDGGQIIHESDDLQATMVSHISGYGNRTADWQLIALPFYNYGDPLEYPIEDLTIGDYDLYGYDEPTRYWINAKDESNETPLASLEACQGYLYANANDIDLSFSGWMVNMTSDWPYILLSCQGEGDMGGFNLVGNPYTYNIKPSDLCFAQSLGDDQYNFPSVQTIYKLSGSNIVAAQGNDAIIKPCEGFFVKAAAEDEALLFYRESRGAKAKPMPFLKVEVERKGHGHRPEIDRAYLNFDATRNMEKLVFDDAAMRLSLVSEGNEYAAFSTATDGTMPLRFTAAHDGIYTLTVSAERTEMAYLHLVDKLTGADIDLLESGSYTFTAMPSDDAMRFEIVFKTK